MAKMGPNVAQSEICNRREALDAGHHASHFGLDIVGLSHGLVDTSDSVTVTLGALLL